MKFFFPAFIVATTTSINAITLLQMLQSYPQLSSLSAYVNASSASTTLLSTANNFTFLAPSNLAIAKYLTQNPNVLTPDLLAATLQYSLLKGGYPSLSFTDMSIFAQTYLSNVSFANVTGGQRMELLSTASSGGMAQMWSGNKTISSSPTADIVCTGGIIHIIDTVPQIPLSTVSQITASNMEYFISILNTGNYLNTANTYVNSILDLPDVTYFIPNSASALATLTAMVKNGTATPEMLKASFEYHVVNGSVVYGGDLKDGMKLKTMQGGEVGVSVREGVMYINVARVVAADFLVANGVVHVIDNLLNPNNTAGPAPLETSNSTSSSSSPLSPPDSSSSSSATSTTGASYTHAPLSDTKSIPSSSSSHHLSTKTYIGIAFGASAFLILLIAVISFLLIRRSRSCSRSNRQTQQPLTMGLNFSPGSSIRSSNNGGSARGEKDIIVKREIEIRGTRGSWESRRDRDELAIGMGVRVEGGYRGVNGAGNGNQFGVGAVNGMGSGHGNGYGMDSMGISARPEYGSTECVAGPPYIPLRSPERGVVSLRREFI